MAGVKDTRGVQMCKAMMLRSCPVVTNVATTTVACLRQSSSQTSPVKTTLLPPHKDARAYGRIIQQMPVAFAVRLPSQPNRYRGPMAMPCLRMFWIYGNAILKYTPRHQNREIRIEGIHYRIIRPPACRHVHVQVGAAAVSVVVVLPPRFR